MIFLVFMTRAYREDIDWLRALAVLSALAFHWGIPPFRGGYVGVDIFFVISGFLITQIIQHEVMVGEFSFIRFYERRIRRLLPALYVMIVLIVFPSLYFLLPSERSEFFRSIVAVVTFTSNIFFWQQTNYFARAADEKLLLHTWSLSVEEQFYLMLPLLVWALLLWQARSRSWILFAGLGVAALGSFAFSHWLMTTGRTATAFFMSPARSWEFLTGSLVAVKGIPVVLNIHWRRVARGIGLALMLVPAIVYRDSSAFPGVAALLPCAGAAIFIWSGLESGAVQRDVWSPLKGVEFFGRISYSLYLWHWPLFIYAKFSKTSLALNVPEKSALFAFAVALSYGSYRFIEQPFRRSSFVSSRRSAFVVAGCSTAILLLVSAAGLVSGEISDMDRRAAQLESYGNDGYDASYRAGACFVESWSRFDDRACLSVVARKTNVLLWGDSLSAHYRGGLEAQIDLTRVNILQANAAACFPALSLLPGFNELCRRFTTRVAEFLQEVTPDIVIISADWLGYSRRADYMMIDEINRTVLRLREKGTSVIVVGPSVQFKSRLPSMLLRAEMRQVEPLPIKDWIVPDIFALDAKMKSSILVQEGVTYVSVLDAVCPEQKCPARLADGVPLSWDHAHLTAKGSILIGAYIAQAAKLSLVAVTR